MATSQVLEIKAKNVECLKTLISVAQSDGNYLGEAWYDVSRREKILTWKYFLCIDPKMHKSIGISAAIRYQCK